MELETLRCRLTAGGNVKVTLEERVYPDISAGQYEAGWWGFDENSNPKQYSEYFLSDYGDLYGWNPKSEHYDLRIGYHPGLVDRGRKLERLYEEGTING